LIVTVIVTVTVTGAVTVTVTVDCWLTDVQKLFLGFDCLSQRTKLSVATLQQKQQPHFCFETSGFQELLPVYHLGTFSGYTCRRLVQSDPGRWVQLLQYLTANRR